MKKKSATNEYAEMLDFLDILIESKEDEINGLLDKCTNLYQELRAREVLMEEKEKITSSDSSMFSPNVSIKLKAFDEEWLSELDSLKKQHDEQMDLLKKAQDIQNSQKKLKSFIIDNFESSDVIKDDEINVSRETNMQSLEIQEMERNRIANDLHDTAVQNLTGLMHKGELCMKLMDMDPIRARMEMSMIIDVARDTIDDIRSSIFELRPASIDDFGLQAAIEDYCNHINPDHKVFFSFKTDGDEKSVSKNVQVNLYRIAQEACINIIKHSNATRASVELKYSDKDVTLVVSDNGVGISKEKLKEAKNSKMHFGLRILDERTKLSGGKIKFFNMKDGGFKIEVVVPKQ